MQQRVWALIDGFNWYYAIRDAIASHLCGPEKKWLDYQAMADAVVRKEVGPNEYTLEVRCYTAFIRGDQQAADRHRWYLRALKARGVVAVEGNYKKKKVRCRADCRKTFDAWEEKATDVNMAIDIVHGAANDEYDTLFLFSGDSDLAPALRRAKSVAPNKMLHVVVPAWRRGMSGNSVGHQELRNLSDKLIRLNFSDLSPELPERVELPDGKFARRPTLWTRPP